MNYFFLRQFAASVETEVRDLLFHILMAERRKRNMKHQKKYPRNILAQNMAINRCKQSSLVEGSRKVHFAVQPSKFQTKNA